MRKHVIIGNGGAAISAIQAIRSINGSDEIVLVSREKCPAYSPVLLIYYLSGRIPYEDIFIRSEEFYRENDVRTFWGGKAVRVEPDSRSVYLDDGSSIQYDDLLVATGSSPLIPAIEGVNLPAVFTFWTAEDARKVLALLDRVNTVAVIGAGLVGMQVLSSLAKQGKRLWLIEALEQIMPRVLDMGGAEIIEERLRNKGVTLYLGDTLLKIQERAESMVLALASGAEIEVDLVILAAGARPNVEILKGSGVKVLQGVLVDDYSRTTVENIYAAGDVAEISNPVTGKSELVATWPNAIEQGWTAGLNMVGRMTPRRRKVRFNAFTFLELFCASAGVVTGGDKRYSEFIRKSDSNYRKLIFQGDSLVGMVLVGEIEEAGILVHFIELQEVYPNLREELSREKAFVSFARVFGTSVGP